MCTFTQSHIWRPCALCVRVTLPLPPRPPSLPSASWERMRGHMLKARSETKPTLGFQHTVNSLASVFRREKKIVSTFHDSVQCAVLLNVFATCSSHVALLHRRAVPVVSDYSQASVNVTVCLLMQTVPLLRKRDRLAGDGNFVLSRRLFCTVRLPKRTLGKAPNAFQSCRRLEV